MTARAFLYVKRIWAPAIALGAAFSFVIGLLAPAVSAGQLELSWVLCLALGVTFPLFVIRSILGLASTDAKGLSFKRASAC